MKRVADMKLQEILDGAEKDENGWPIDEPHEGDHSVRYSLAHLDVNNAGERATQIILRAHGMEAYEQGVGRFRDHPKGYLGMLEEKPTPAGLGWASLVTGFVNEWDQKTDVKRLLEALLAIRAMRQREVPSTEVN